MEADLDRDGKISFEEFTKMVENTDVSMSMTLGTCLCCYTRLLYPISITACLVAGNYVHSVSFAMAMCFSVFHDFLEGLVEGWRSSFLL